MRTQIRKIARTVCAAVIGLGLGLSLMPPSDSQVEGAGRTSRRYSSYRRRTTPRSSSRPVRYTKRRVTKDIIETAVGPGMQTVTTLVKAVQAAELVEALKSEGPFTVFAPTNDAFAKLPKETLADLLKPENKGKLKSILLYHVHAGNAVRADSFRDKMELPTLNGKAVEIRVEGPTAMVENATVTKTDVVATNGVIHWIDTVILP